MSHKIGVLLSGCGVFDGAEIHEAVITLLTLDRVGAEVIAIAPDITQTKVVNHLTSEESSETRNVLEESARISRGKITRACELNPDEIDALIIPGGFGAALNNCTFAIDGPSCSVDSAVEKLISATLEAGKPLGAMCIAPALVARVADERKLKLTIGSDSGVASAIESLGHTHIECPPDEIVCDDKNKVVTTPAYMSAGGIAEAAEGIEKLVKKVIDLI